MDGADEDRGWDHGWDVTLTRTPIPAMRPDLAALFDRAELAKYVTGEELASIDAASTKDGE